MRKLCQNSVYYEVVLVKRTVQVLLLDKVETNCFVPVELTDFGKHGFDLLRLEDLQSKEDEPNCKVRMLLSDLLTHLIDDIHIDLLLMDLYLISFNVVLLQFG
jgi:hypothetical protein